jgi:hypothetical protein
MTARDRSGARALAAAGVTGLIAFALFLIGGLALWAIGHYRDADGYLATASERVVSSGYAIATDDLEVGAGAPGLLLKPGRYGTIRLQVAPHGGKPLFVGIARTADVQRYLGRSDRSVVEAIDYTPFAVRYAQRTGTRAPGPPGTQRIWAAHGSRGLTWDVRSGDWSVVVMNADGSPNVHAGVSAGARVPYLSTLSFGALGLGLLFVVATAALTLHGTRPVVRRLAAAT